MGLRSGKIIEINEASGAQKCLLATHHEGETWGLELIPENNAVFTCVTFDTDGIAYAAGANGLVHLFD